MMELQERCNAKHQYPEAYDNKCPYCVSKYGYKPKDTEEAE